MKLSYEGIGQWAATFSAAGAVVGEVVKLSENGTVAACNADEEFCGVVLSTSRAGDACAVALGGLVTTGYSGTAPALGWSGLHADGTGGVKAAAAGRSHLVVDVDADGKTVTFTL